jgi:hypothetical protein
MINLISGGRIGKRATKVDGFDAMSMETRQKFGLWFERSSRYLQTACGEKTGRRMRITV